MREIRAESGQKNPKPIKFDKIIITHTNSDSLPNMKSGEGLS